MRARNREINIFNMSLLDILTGMLGAFLFLMVGLVPYYAKVLNSALITADEKAKFEELKKLLDKGLKGPLSPEEAEQLRSEIERLTGENEQLKAKNEQLDKDLAQAKQDLQNATDENAFWNTQRVALAFNFMWDSADADIDLFILAPDGNIYGPKKEKLLGKAVLLTGEDSHGPAGDGSTYKTSYETSTTALGSGEYLLFYRVPNNVAPSAYPTLFGYWAFQEIVYDAKKETKGSVWVHGGPLMPANAAKAKPGGLYAWALFSYDADKKTVVWKPPPAKLPPGIQLPQ